ncbi:MAG: DMT family transporter [Candidatus Puniceispirillaceae bacterium]
MTKQAWGLLLLLSAIWGASFLFIEMALVAMGPVTLVFFRVLIGSMTLGLYVMARGLSLPRSFAFWRSVFVMGVLNNAIPFYLIAYGQLSITGGMASIINANTAFFGVLVAAIFISDETLSARRIIGVLTGVCGVVIVVGPSELLRFDVASIGQIAVVLATLSYAFASVWGRLTLQGYDTTITAFATASCATSVLAVIMLATDGVPSFALTPSLLIVAIGLGVIGTGGAYMLYFRILSLAGASNLMLVTIIVPVFAVTLDALILGQWIGMRALFGFVVIALGLIVMDGRLLRHIYPKT